MLKSKHTLATLVLRIFLMKMKGKCISSILIFFTYRDRESNWIYKPMLAKIVFVFVFSPIPHSIHSIINKSILIAFKWTLSFNQYFLKSFFGGNYCLLCFIRVAYLRAMLDFHKHLTTKSQKQYSAPIFTSDVIVLVFQPHHYSDYLPLGNQSNGLCKSYRFLDLPFVTYVMLDTDSTFPASVSSSIKWRNYYVVIKNK